MLFDVQVNQTDGRQDVSVVGDVDLATLTRLWPTLERLEGDHVVLDLRSVDWFDPVCLGVLVATELRARRRGGRLTVVPAPALAALVAECGLDAVLELSDTPAG